MRIYMDSGKIAASVSHAYVPPIAGSTTPARLLVCVPGAGADVSIETTRGRGPSMVRSLAFSRAGLAHLWLSTPSGQWANDALLTAIEQARVWANTNLPVLTDQVLMYGNSAGFAAAAAYAADHPAVVRALAGTFPVVDIQDIRDNNRQGLAASIDTAAGNTPGIAPGDAWYAARNPNRRQANLTGIPQKLWTSSDDPTALPAPAAAYATAVGASVEDMGALNHAYSGSTALGPVPINDVATWLTSHA